MSEATKVVLTTLGVSAALSLVLVALLALG
jgi:hypothetical protein